MSSLPSDAILPPDVTPDAAPSSPVSSSSGPSRPAPPSLNPLPPPLITLPPLDASDSPHIPAERFKRTSVAIGGKVRFERGVCTGTRLDTQPCDRPAFTRQLCQACYRRARRQGDIGKGGIGRITLTFDDVHEKFLALSATLKKKQVWAGLEGVSVHEFQKAIGVKSAYSARHWLTRLERGGIAVMRIGLYDARWHPVADVAPRPPPEPQPPPPPRPAPPPGRGGRRRRVTNDARDQLRAVARGWPKGW